MNTHMEIKHYDGMIVVDRYTRPLTYMFSCCDNLGSVQEEKIFIFRINFPVENFQIIFLRHKYGGPMKKKKLACRPIGWLWYAGGA